MYRQCGKTLCGYQMDRCLFTLKSEKKRPKSWAAALKIAQLYEIIRLYDISRLDSIDLYLMKIDVILLLYIHFLVLSNSIYFSVEKS